MIKVYCSKCGKELQKHGALVFSPPSPFEDQTRKYHICTVCWDEVEVFINPA